MILFVLEVPSLSSLSQNSEQTESKILRLVFRMSHRFWEQLMEPLGTESYFSVIKTMGSSCLSQKLSKRRNFLASSQVT